MFSASVRGTLANLIAHILYRPALERTIVTGVYQSLCTLSPSEILITRVGNDGQMQLETVSLGQKVSQTKPRCKTLWRSSAAPQVNPLGVSNTPLTAILPLELDTIILGYGEAPMSRECSD